MLQWLVESMCGILRKLPDLSLEWLHVMDADGTRLACGPGHLCEHHQMTTNKQHNTTNEKGKAKHASVTGRAVRFV